MECEENASPKTKIKIDVKLVRQALEFKQKEKKRSLFGRRKKSLGVIIRKVVLLSEKFKSQFKNMITWDNYLNLDVFVVSVKSHSLFALLEFF